MVSEGDIITVFEYEDMLRRINDLLWSRCGDNLPEEESETGNLRLYVQDEQGQRQDIQFIDGDVVVGNYVKGSGESAEYEWQSGNSRAINFLIDELSIIQSDVLPPKVNDEEYITPTQFEWIDGLISGYEKMEPDSVVSGCGGKCSGLCISTCIGFCKTSCSEECVTSCIAECVDICSTGCSQLCTSICREDCTGGCVGVGCEGQCEGGCSNSCNTGCKGSCKNGCGKKCQGTCEGYCDGGCKGTCQYSWCSSSCTGDCRGLTK